MKQKAATRPIFGGRCWNLQHSCWTAMIKIEIYRAKDRCVKDPKKDKVVEVCRDIIDLTTAQWKLQWKIGEILHNWRNELAYTKVRSPVDTGKVKNKNSWRDRVIRSRLKFPNKQKSRTRWFADSATFWRRWSYLWSSERKEAHRWSVLDWRITALSILPT